MMHHHSIRKTRLTGIIVDLITLETCDGDTELGILSLQTDTGLRCAYAEGRALKSACECIFPHGWKGRRVNLTLESQSVVFLEPAP